MPPITLAKTVQLDDRLRALLARCREMTDAVTPAGRLAMDVSEVTILFQDVVTWHLDQSSANWICRPETAMIAVEFMLCIRNLLGAIGVCVRGLTLVSDARSNGCVDVQFVLAQKVAPALVACVPVWTQGDRATIAALVAEHAALIEATSDLYERPMVPGHEDKVILGAEPQPRSHVEALLVVLAVIGLLSKDALTSNPAMTMATAWAKSRIALLENFEYSVRALVPIFRHLEPMSTAAIEILQRSASRWLADVFILDAQALMAAGAFSSYILER